VETLLFRARNKVATALANPDWRRRLAPSRALLIWPFGFLRTKSMATGGAEHLKMGVTLAGGTVVPLIAFGLVQVLLSDPQETPQDARRVAVSQVAGAQASGSLLRERLLLLDSMPKARAGTTVRMKAHPRKHAASPKKSTAPAPNAAANPVARDEPKIVLCHGTHAEERPAVTISVSGHALEGLSKDTQGACG
jgi:hypothetical protein